MFLALLMPEKWRAMTYKRRQDSQTHLDILKTNVISVKKNASLKLKPII